MSMVLVRLLGQGRDRDRCRKRYRQRVCTRPRICGRGGRGRRHRRVGRKDVASEIEGVGGKAIGVRVDVADEASTNEMARAATEAYGGIDYLVNNAAVFGGMKLDLLLTVDWDYLQRFMAVNLTGALLCTRACYEQIAARGGGAIVNQSSTAAYLYAGYYGWAKAGINSLTSQLAHELGGMQHPGQCDRSGTDRHRGRPVGGARRVPAPAHRIACAQAAGDAGRSCRYVSVPPLGSRALGDGSRLQRRRRTGGASLMTTAA